MSPLGLFLIGIGLLMIIIGVKGSQKNVLKAFKGVKTSNSKGK